MIPLNFINVFAADIDRLATYYQALFALEEIMESRSPIFRGFDSGGCSIGFSAYDAYEILGLEAKNGPGADTFVLTFDVDSPAEVERMSQRAVELGGTLVKPAFETYYGWYLSVLRDPEGNAFRINFRG